MERTKQKIIDDAIDEAKRIVEKAEEETSKMLAEIIELKKQIALLQAENRELRNRPNIVTDTYIETQNVKQQCNYLPHSRRTSRYKLNNSTQTQLQLWNTPTATSM